jgi:hypothetical protein
VRARVIVTNAPASALETGIQLTKDVLVPAARDQDGYRGYVAIYDEETGRSLAITLWENRATERASDEKASSSREEEAKALGAKILSVDKYDVAVAELA